MVTLVQRGSIVGGIPSFIAGLALKYLQRAPFSSDLVPVWNGSEFQAVACGDAFEPSQTLGALNTYTASHVAIAADAGATVEMNAAGANTFTLPPGLFPLLARIDVVQLGAGATTLVAGAGVTILSEDGNLVLGGRYAGVSLYQRATNVWVAIGSLA